MLRYIITMTVCYVASWTWVQQAPALLHHMQAERNQQQQQQQQRQQRQSFESDMLDSQEEPSPQRPAYVHRLAAASSQLIRLLHAAAANASTAALSGAVLMGLVEAVGVTFAPTALLPYTVEVQVAEAILTVSHQALTRATYGFFRCVSSWVHADNKRTACKR